MNIKRVNLSLLKVSKYSLEDRQIYDKLDHIGKPTKLRLLSDRSLSNCRLYCNNGTYNHYIQIQKFRLLGTIFGTSTTKHFTLNFGKNNDWWVSSAQWVCINQLAVILINTLSKLVISLGDLNYAYNLRAPSMDQRACHVYH